MAAYYGPLEPFIERSLEKAASIERLMDDRKPEHADVIFPGADATVHAEVVSSPRDLGLGLMFRTDLQSGQGMLFKFPDRGRHSMWMKNTPLPLDMIFLDKDGKVVAVIERTMPYSEKTLTPGADSDWVLETMAGFVQDHQIKTGMRFEVRPWTEKKANPDVLDGPDKTIKKIEVLGIPVNIERPKGTIKLFKDKSTQFYHNDYGSIPVIDGVDGDPLDVFVGPDKGSKRVFVVEKMQEKDHSKFDEHKVLLGFKGKVEARQVAKKHLWGTDGKIHESSLETFKDTIGLKTAAEFAPGIPEKGRFVDIPTVQVPQQWEFAVQKHDATRAGCFAAGTMISMADGSLRPIERVCVGDAVATHKGVAGVSHVWDNGLGDEWVEVLHGQSRITCTPQHRFWVSGRGWVSAEEMDSLPYQEDSAAADEGVSGLRVRVFTEVSTDTDMRASMRPAPGAQDQRQQGESSSAEEEENPERSALEALCDLPSPIQGPLGEFSDVQPVVRNAPWLDQERAKEARADKGAEDSTWLGGGSPPCRSPGRLVPPAAGPRVAGSEVRDGGLEPGRGGCPGGLYPHARAHSFGQARHSDAEGTQPSCKIEDSRSQELELAGWGVQREADWRSRVCSAVEISEGEHTEEARGDLRVVREGVPSCSPYYPIPVLSRSLGGESSGAVQEVPQQSGSSLQGDGWKVLHVRRLPRVGRRRYDLEVEGQGCYVAGGFLVHNSHFDLRLGDPSTGDAFSWALKKLPEPGKGTYAPMQPTHTVGYMNFKGEIPEGSYGAGKVELSRRSKAEVVKATPEEVRFNVYEGKVPEQFVLKQHGGRMWTLHNVTPARGVKKWEHLIPTDKPSLKEIPFKKLDPSRTDEVYQPKIDGAHGIAVVEGGKPVRFFSYREAQNPTGLIEHTHRMPGWWDNTAPEGMKPSVIRGEIYGTDRRGKPVPAAQVGGLLNTGVLESREKQEQQGVKLRFAAFDVDRHDGKKMVGLDPERTEQILTDLSRQVPGIEVMPTAKTPVEKAKLVAAISAGKHPLTHEGIVARSVETGKAIKAKLKSDYDVYIRQVYAGTKPGEAGGFRFSHTQHGPLVGNVGGGFKRTERQEMLLNPEKWIGRVAKVEAEQQFPSGALRAPIYKAPHETKGLQPYHELA